jgi:hypothetical protein
VKDGEEHTMREGIEKAAEICNLSHEERTQLFPEPPEIERRGHVGRSIS